MEHEASSKSPLTACKQSCTVAFFGVSWLPRYSERVRDQMLVPLAKTLTHSTDGCPGMGWEDRAGFI